MASSADYLGLSFLACFLLSASGGSLFRGSRGYGSSERIRFRSGGERNTVIVDVPSSLVSTPINNGDGMARGSGIVNGDLYGDYRISVSPTPARNRVSSSESTGESASGNGVGNILKITTVGGGTADRARYELAGAYRINNRDGIRDLHPVSVVPVQNGGSTDGRLAQPKGAWGDISTIRIINRSGTDAHSGAPRPGTIVYDLRDGSRSIVRGENRNTNSHSVGALQNIANSGFGGNYNLASGGNGGGVAGNIIKIINLDGDRGSRGVTLSSTTGAVSSADGGVVYGGRSSLNLSGGSSGTVTTGRRDANGNVPTIRINLPDVGNNEDVACAISEAGREGENSGSGRRYVGANPVIRINLAEAVVGGNRLRNVYEGSNGYSGVNGNGGGVKYVYKL